MRAFSFSIFSLLCVVTAIFVFEPHGIRRHFANDRWFFRIARGEEFRGNRLSGRLRYPNNKWEANHETPIDAAEHFAKSCNSMFVIGISIINAAQDREDDRMVVLGNCSWSPASFHDNWFTWETGSPPYLIGIGHLPDLFACGGLHVVELVLLSVSGMRGNKCGYPYISSGDVAEVLQVKIQIYENKFCVIPIGELYWTGKTNICPDPWSVLVPQDGQGSVQRVPLEYRRTKAQESSQSDKESGCCQPSGVPYKRIIFGIMMILAGCAVLAKGIIDIGNYFYPTRRFLLNIMAICIGWLIIIHGLFFACTGTFAHG